MANINSRRYTGTSSIKVPSEYKYIIDRLIYDISTREHNLAFMISIKQNEPDFLDSELFNEMLDECISARINHWIVISGIMETLGIKGISFSVRGDGHNTGYTISY